MGSVRQMLMMVTKLFLLLNLVVDVYPMTEEELKILIHLHQEDGAPVDESGTAYILDHKNQAAADGINSSPYGSSWTTRPDSPCIEKDMFYDGYDLRNTQEKSAEACACACQDDEDCGFFTWEPSHHIKCHMKTGIGKKKYKSGTYSGSGNCCKNREKCGEHNLPCKDCGYHDCQESEKCKWSSGSGNGKWTPHGPYGVCKPRDEDKCGDNNRPCEYCGYYDCQESEKCKWSSGSGNGNDKWRPQGPYGVCKQRDEDKCGDDNLPCKDCGYYDCQESEKCKWSSGSGKGKWSPQGPYGVCKPKDPNCVCKGWDDGCWWGRTCDIHCYVDCPDKKQVAPNKCTSSLACDHWLKPLQNKKKSRK